MTMSAHTSEGTLSELEAETAESRGSMEMWRWHRHWGGEGGDPNIQLLFTFI